MIKPARGRSVVSHTVAWALALAVVVISRPDVVHHVHSTRSGAAFSDRLLPGQSVGTWPGATYSYLQSANGLFTIAPQSDGFLAEVEPDRWGAAIVASGYFGQTSAGTTGALVMETNGGMEFVQYDATTGAEVSQTMESPTQNGAAGSTAVLQGDANFVVYEPNGRLIWANDPLEGLIAGTDDQGNPEIATMEPGDVLHSQTFNYSLVMQGDGNLVEYGQFGAVWWTGTWGHPGAQLTDDAQGNLAVVDTNGARLWSSNSVAPSGVETQLTVEDNGTIDLSTAFDSPIWSRALPAPPASQLTAGQSLTAGQKIVSANPAIQLVVQGDGNVVLYSSHGATWSTRTWGTGPNDTLVLQGDGNLVLYGPKGALWSSRTWGSGANRLTVQADGNLVLYKGNSPIWSTHTNGRT